MICTVYNIHYIYIMYSMPSMAVLFEWKYKRGPTPCDILYVMYRYYIKRTVMRWMEFSLID